MIKILLIADIHGEFENLSKFIDKHKNLDFDLVVCPGDFTDMFNVPEGYSQMDVAELIIQKILSLGKPTFCVPGNHEPYEILELFDEYNVNLHNSVRKFKSLTFMGFGGAATPFNTKFEPTEEEIKEHLEHMTSQTKGNLVLVTHTPPYETKLDKTKEGHVGSRAVKEFILKHQPSLAISAHIHENQGTDKIKKTLVFYPGPIFEGYFGLITIGKQIRCEVKKMKD
jgi:hypothetical protein